MFKFNKEQVEDAGGAKQTELIPKRKLTPDYKWKINIKVIPNVDLKSNIIPTQSLITNNKNLPDLLFRRLCIKNYYDPTGAFISASGLTLNPKQFFFKNRYENAQIVDANEIVAPMIGTSVHNYMEEITYKDELTEKRFTVTIDGKLISGQLDHYGNGILSDYKITKAWQKKYRNMKMESGKYENDAYVVQLNFLAYLLRKHGYPVKKARLIFIYKDYDQYIYKTDYPFTQSEEEWIPLWSNEKVETMLTNKIIELTSIPESMIQLHLCSDDNMWRAPLVYSLHKIGSSRALPNTKCNDIDIIEKKLEARLNKYKKEQMVPLEWYDYSEKQKIENVDLYTGMLYVHMQQNEPKFCMNYCPGRYYCMQYQEWYCGNKRYKIKIKQNSKEKIIEMYGDDYMDAITKVKMIHSKDCIVEHPKANHKGVSKYFEGME